MEQREHRERIRQQFGRSASAYVASTGHASGDDLTCLVAWAEGGPDRIALDVATGGGHTALALAPLFGRVVASDLTEQMLQVAEAFIRERDAANVEFCLADAESLPFLDGAFDLVACRIAPHHFPDVARFVAEVGRVLRPGGVFLLEDSLVPDDPTLADLLNHAEALRDSTHVRSLSRGEWRGLLAGAGFVVEAEASFAKEHPFEDWLDRARTPDAVRATLRAIFRAAPPPVRRAFGIVVDAAGNVVSYTDEKIAFKARRSSHGGHEG